MNPGWPQQRYSTTSLAGSIALHALALIIFLTYRQPVPEPPKAQPPLDVVFVPTPIDLIAPERSDVGSGDHQRAEAAPPRSGPPSETTTTLIPPSPIPPLIANPVPPPTVAPVASPPSSASARPSVAGNPAGTGKGAGSGGGDGSGTGLVTLGREAWIRQATTNDWARYYPRYSVKTDAQVVLSCLIDPKNRVHSCIVLNERPNGYGIGNAVVAMSRVFRARPPMVNGQPRYDVRVGIRLVLRAPDEGPVDLQGPF